jgi:hypothetical protein
VLQERIRPAFEDAPFDIHSQVRALRIQDNLNLLDIQTFANAECLAEQMNLAVNGHLANDSNSLYENLFAKISRQQREK